MNVRPAISWCKGLGRRRPEGRVTALASFPGSGNTWVRYLLQQATGVLTGSIYTDGDLRKNGFHGESVRDGSVLVVKTHEWGEKSRAMYQGAILLVREPVDCILSEFNRERGGGHTGHAGKGHFHNEGGKIWKDFLKTKLTKWEEMNLDWMNNFAGPLLLVSYSQLVSNLRQSLEQILAFLELPVHRGDLDCALARQEGVFKRQGRQIEILLDQHLKYLVNNSRNAVLKSFADKINNTMNKL